MWRNNYSALQKKKFLTKKNFQPASDFFFLEKEFFADFFSNPDSFSTF